MKTIPLTQGYAALVDDEDYEFLRRVGRWHIHKKKGDPSIHVRHCYKLANGKLFNVFMHWLVAAQAGLDTSKTMDHVDRNGLNNTRLNLRPATPAQQKMNSSIHRNSVSRIKGVRLLPSGSWRARIRINNKLLHLGCFPSKEEAAAAYRIAAIKYFGEFASPNKEIL